MRTKLNRKGVAGYATTVAAILGLAITFTINGCSSGDDNGNDPGNNSSGSSDSSKNSCIEAELNINANTLDDVVKACNAIRSDVLSLFPSNIGSCNKNNLDFGKPIKDIMAECDVDEIPIVDGGNVSSSSRGGSNSSSSLGGRSSNSGNEEPPPPIKDCPVDYDQATHFCDERDGQLYEYVKIGNQTWMAENLNYYVQGSLCYDDTQANCEIYGRLYDWVVAMALPKPYYYTYFKADFIEAEGDAAFQVGNTLYSELKHKGICPSGWHIPSEREWRILVKYTGGKSSDNGVNQLAGCDANGSAGMDLRATTGWGDGYNGFDKHGFKALPGGTGTYPEDFWNGKFSGKGSSAWWWTSTDAVFIKGYNAWAQSMSSTLVTMCSYGVLYSMASNGNGYSNYVQQNGMGITECHNLYCDKGNKEMYLLSMRCIKD
jgi:uncharacterized protein (TIGR02145 family)